MLDHCDECTVELRRTAWFHEGRTLCRDCYQAELDLKTNWEQADDDFKSLKKKWQKYYESQN